jgi:hypothetical protein
LEHASAISLASFSPSKMGVTASGPNQGDFGKELCCEVERRGASTADWQGKEPGTTAAKGTDLVEGRCLGTGEGWSDSRIIEALDTSPSLRSKCGRPTSSRSAQDGDVFGRQTKTRLQLGVIELDEQRPDALLTRIVLGPN